MYDTLNTPKRRLAYVGWVALMIVAHISIGVTLWALLIPQDNIGLWWLGLIILGGMFVPLVAIALEYGYDALSGYIKCGNAKVGDNPTLWDLPKVVYRRKDDAIKTKARELEQAEMVLKREGIL